ALEANDDAWRIQVALLEFLETGWLEPDAGIWEQRGPPRHYVHSALMTWVAADRAVKAVERFGIKNPPDRWRRLRAEARERILSEGFDAERNSFVQTFGGKELDAALLMLPLVGFLPADDPRVIGTAEAIQREL